MATKAENEELKNKVRDKKPCDECGGPRDRDNSNVCTACLEAALLDSEEKGNRPASPPFVEAEFEETLDLRPPPNIHDDDDDAIIPEVVGPHIRPADVQAVSVEEDKFKAFLSGLQSDLDVTLIVKRLSDHGLKFRIPYPSGPPKKVRTEYWDGRSADDIYEVIMHEEGGGRYNIQSQYGGGLQEAWTVVLDDPAEPSIRELTMRGETKSSEAERIPAASPPFAPPLPADSKSAFIELKERLQEAKEIRELLGGDERPAAAPDPIPLKDQIALEMMKHVNQSSDGELPTQVIKKILGLADPKEEKSWSDVVWHGISNADKVAGMLGAVVNVAGPLFNMLTGKPATPPNAASRSLATLPAAVVGVSMSGLVMPPPADMAAAGVVMPPTGPSAADAAATASESVPPPQAASVAQPAASKRISWA